MLCGVYGTGTRRKETSESWGGDSPEVTFIEYCIDSKYRDEGKCKISLSPGKHYMVSPRNPKKGRGRRREQEKTPPRESAGKFAKQSIKQGEEKTRTFLGTTLHAEEHIFPQDAL